RLFSINFGRSSGTPRDERPISFDLRRENAYTTYMKKALMLPLCLACSAVAFGQGSPVAQTGAVTPDIPGVVAGGTKIELIKEGFEGSEGGVPLPDGSMLFSETAASR